MQGKVGPALERLRQAVRLQPDWVPALNRLAWVLATASDEKFRDGPAAVLLAQKANRITGYRNPDLLDTLAAAYAEAGRFPDAVQTAQRAMAAAVSSGNQELAGKIAPRLERYKAGQPNREDLGRANAP
jgi:predicted Zn-dependent protease